MENRRNVTHEEWAVEGLANMLTRGHLDIVRNFFYLLVRVTAAQTTVFFRAKFGSKAVSLGTVLWGWLLFAGIWSFETIGRVDFKMSYGTDMAGNSSVWLFWLHLVLFIGFALYRILEAKRNLRLHIQERHGEDTGISLLWPLVARLLRPMGLVSEDASYTAWYQLNEFKFQKWIEPAGVILLGLLFKELEFSAYGSFLILSGLSIMLMVSIQEMNYYTFRQSQWDAKIASGLLDNSEGDVTQRSGMVVPRTLMAQETADYERWRESRINPFDQAETIPANS